MFLNFDGVKLFNIHPLAELCRRQRLFARTHSYARKVTKLPVLGNPNNRKTKRRKPCLTFVSFTLFANTFFDLNKNHFFLELQYFFDF